MDKPGTLPLKEYFALHAYLSTLLVLSFVFLPHSSPWSGQGLSTGTAQRSSADRPEHRFLTPITSRPVGTMLWDLAGMSVCMAWWGHRLLRWSTGTGSGSGAGKKSDLVGENELVERQQRMANMLKRAGTAGVSALAMSIVFAVLIFTLGAPLDSHILHTLLFALHLSVLVVWPVVHVLGVPSIYDKGLNARFRMTRLFCEFRPETPFERALVYPVVGTLVGAWIGVIPIPLDWDRPWQSYPLTPTFASILGFIVGGFISFFHSALEESLTQGQVSTTPVSNKNKKKKKKA